MSPSNQLTERERDVVAQVLQGKSNKMIAQALGISTRTVEFHLKNIFVKFGVSSRIELVLALGKSAGAAIPVSSAVEDQPPTAENAAKPDRSRDRATSSRAAASLTGQRPNMHTRLTYFVSHGTLWAAAIIAAAILGAPTFFTFFLLPALAVSALFVAGPTRAKSDPAQGGA